MNVTSKKMMKITTKLQLTFLGIGSLLGAVAIVSVFNFNRLDQNIESIYNNQVVPISQLSNISDYYSQTILAINQVENNLKISSKALQEIGAAQAGIDELWSDYSATELTPKEVELRKQIDELYLPADQAMSRVLDILGNASSEQEKAQQLIAMEKDVYATVNPILEKVKALSDLQTEIAFQEQQRSNQLVIQMWFLFIPILVFTLGFIIAGRAIVNTAVLSAIRETIASVSSSANQIAVATEEQERVAANQASSVTRTSTTMDELESSARQSAQQAESATLGASTVLGLARQGTDAVGRSLAEMTHLRETVLAIADSINQLTGQIAQIDNYQQLVSEIANQTNMLALNAAVEAVRAGEQGKGFTVVATEIRKLADQSKQSAQNINNLVRDIREAIRNTVNVTEQGTKQVETGQEITEETAQTFEQVTNAIDGIVTSSQQISLNARQQAIAIAEVLKAMEELSQSAQQTTAGVRQTFLGTQNLTNLATTLQDLL